MRRIHNSNAANEIAVEAFLDRRIGSWTSPRRWPGSWTAWVRPPADTLDDVVGLDAAARGAAERIASARAA